MDRKLDIMTLSKAIETRSNSATIIVDPIIYNLYRSIFYKHFRQNLDQTDRSNVCHTGHHVHETEKRTPVQPGVWFGWSPNRHWFCCSEVWIQCFQWDLFQDLWDAEPIKPWVRDSLQRLKRKGSQQWRTLWTSKQPNKRLEDHVIRVIQVSYKPFLSSACLGTCKIRRFVVNKAIFEALSIVLGKTGIK